MFLRHWLAWVILIGLCAVVATAVASDDCRGWVAKGDGILVTPQDVQSVATFFKGQNIVTGASSYKDAAIKMMLYSFEAEQLELGSAREDRDLQSAEYSVEYLMFKSERYRQWLMDQQDVAEIVIESYFRSFPERFSDLSETRPTDAISFDVRERIRRLVLEARKQSIDQEAFEGLKKRYNVRMCRESS